MLEIHHYPPFIPSGCRAIFVGSFPGKIPDGGLQPNDWYYGTGPTRNQFWPIMRSIYHLPLLTKEEKMHWCETEGFGFADIIFSCERKGNSNLDSNLYNKTYATELFDEIFRNQSITRLLFTAKGVLQEFQKHFAPPAHLHALALPSPSPAFASMSLAAKTVCYSEILKTINN